MASDRHELANSQIRHVTYLGVWVNIGLSAVKIVVGLLTGSLALVADGIHSFSDFATDIALLLGVYWGGKKPDDCHPFGHGRFETFVTVLMGGGLVFLGCGMLYKAVVEISRMNTTGNHTLHIGVGVIWTAILAVIAKEWLYRVTRRVAMETHSTMVYANAWEHRSDALSSIAVVIGAVSVRYWHYPHGDQIAAMIVGIMILLVAVKILGDCFHEFSERAVDAETLRQIQTIINAQQGIHQWHRLRTRSVGREVFLDVHILVDPVLNITEAHEIAETLETALIEQLSQPVNVMVHIEPDLPRLRK
jgi:cation diffusion facilitator family transporter